MLSRSVVSNSFCVSLNCSPPGSSVNGISQVRILERVAIAYFRLSFRPRDQACISCVGKWILYHWATWEAWIYHHLQSRCFCPGSGSWSSFCCWVSPISGDFLHLFVCLSSVGDQGLSFVLPSLKDSRRVVYFSAYPASLLLGTNWKPQSSFTKLYYLLLFSVDDKKGIIVISFQQPGNIKGF